jgi:hypothetical protein
MAFRTAIFAFREVRRSHAESPMRGSALPSDRDGGSSNFTAPDDLYFTIVSQLLHPLCPLIRRHGVTEFASCT